MGVHNDQYRTALALFAQDLRRVHRLAGEPSYDELARVTGYSKASISRYLSGGTLPRWHVLEALLNAWGVENTDQAKAQWVALRQLADPIGEADEPTENRGVLRLLPPPDERPDDGSTNSRPA